MARKPGFCLLTFAVFLVFFASARADDGSIDQRCEAEASKLTECVGYASGEEATPTSQCCGSVSDVRGKDPACLCLVIRRAHDGGSGGVSGIHLHLDRLLSLPKACALANSSVSYCPSIKTFLSQSSDHSDEEYMRLLHNNDSIWRVVQSLELTQSTMLTKMSRMYEGSSGRSKSFSQGSEEGIRWPDKEKHAQDMGSFSVDKRELLGKSHLDRDKVKIHSIIHMWVLLA